MKLNNVTEIRPDDFKNEDRQTIGQLAEILNPFMQQVVELADGRVSYDNLDQNLINVEFTVDSNGVPQLNNKMKTGKSGARGFNVVAAYNLTNVNVYPTSQPFIIFTPLGGDIVQINKITGLPANNKFRLVVEVK